MRRTLLGMAAAAIVLVPVWVMAGNQEFAEEIAAGLRDCGQLRNYKIGVKFQDGTAWLRGHVGSREQMNAALKQVLQTSGVNRVVNNLQVAEDPTAATFTTPTPETKPAAQRPSPQGASQRGQPLQQASGALGTDNSGRLPAVRALASSTPPMAAPSHTAARIEQVASEPKWTRTHPPASPTPPPPALSRTGAPIEQAASNPVRTPTHPPASSTPPTAAPSRTATRIEQAASEPKSTRTHSVEVVPVTKPPAGGQVNRLASSFVTALAHTAMAVIPKKRPTPASRPVAKAKSTATPEPALASQAAAPAAAVAAPPAAAPQAAAPAAAAATAPRVAVFAMVPPTGAPIPVGAAGGAPIPQYVTPASGGMPPARYDQPNMPNYAWPSYAAYPNYAALTYPKQYSPTAWPYIGPFYPYPQVPLGWRKVTLEWHDGWWQLDFDDGPRNQWFSGLFRPPR